ncbi:hypothetical protein ACTWJ9_33380 (plasmid) [Streptomyces sp. GDS52]|uniref:hypothetical protein n=1 Tax=Streptomyces sp. GDS52 TaxID=3406419 RepID=UPI003FD44001
MGARVLSVSAAAVLTAAAAVYALLHERDRRLRREAVSERLMAGCAARDNVVLRAEVERFRRRLGQEVARPPTAAAGTRIEPSSERGPQ